MDCAAPIAGAARASGALRQGGLNQRFGQLRVLGAGGSDAGFSSLAEDKGA